jgi:hypothetical protein
MTKYGAFRRISMVFGTVSDTGRTKLGFETYFNTSYLQEQVAAYCARRVARYIARRR